MAADNCSGTGLALLLLLLLLLPRRKLHTLGFSPAAYRVRVRPSSLSSGDRSGQATLESVANDDLQALQTV